MPRKLFVQAVALWQAGHQRQSIDSFRQAALANPEDVQIAANLAAALHAVGEFVEAESHIRRGIEREPLRAQSWHTLGDALLGQQRWFEAAQAFKRSLSLDPSLALGHPKAADALFHHRDYAGAAQHYVASPNLPTTTDWQFLTRAAESLLRSDKPAEAISIYEKVARNLPNEAAAHSNCGIALQAIGRHEEAITCYRQALACEPTVSTFWSNLLGSLNYSEQHSPFEVKEAAEAFERNCATGLRTSRQHANERDPSRRLRVGYLSPDLRRHAVAYFLLPMLEQHADEFEIVCYHDADTNDEWTAKLRAAADVWVPCSGMSDEALADKIRDDRIDILIDLAGHTQGNRLLVFARKPAPVQASWLGYVITTGLQAMDWRLTYPMTDPQGTEQHYVERTLRIDAPMWGYRPLRGMPPVAPSPHRRKGFVTFGHFNRFSKVTPLAMETWAAILAAVPHSRLVIGLPEGAIRTTVARFFEARGVAANRIDAYGKMEHARFWAMHAEVDIALDPFPFNGGTTSYETLWLGVPLVTCTGESGGFAPRFSSRMGSALLHALGVPELVANSPAEYVEIASGLARDPARLDALRGSLRGRMQASLLLDEKKSVLALEAAYRSMWRTWCEQGAS